jgi:hypothetical protein
MGGLKKHFSADNLLSAIIPLAAVRKTEPLMTS